MMPVYDDVLNAIISAAQALTALRTVPEVIFPNRSTSGSSDGIPAAMS